MSADRQTQNANLRGYKQGCERFWNDKTKYTEMFMFQIRHFSFEHPVVAPAAPLWPPVPLPQVLIKKENSPALPPSVRYVFWYFFQASTSFSYL